MVACQNVVCRKHRPKTRTTGGATNYVSVCLSIIIVIDYDRLWWMIIDSNRLQSIRMPENNSLRGELEARLVVF